MHGAAHFPNPLRSPKRTPMNTISLISTVAMALGLSASFPQILRMLSARSAGGQSIVGWAMGLGTNLCLAYVNAVGYGAIPLMASNIITAVLCSVACVLILRFREPATEATKPEDYVIEIPSTPWLAPSASDARHGHIVGLPTTEFEVLRDAVFAAERTRRERQPAELVAQAA